ncbi:endoplasmic reticulum-Golgi intermediate compartment protein 3-like isoform X4 [Falco rusticolus]|uniref:endoplasmic reticulum-Golgi intermediate compartment protein 3-like isoform X4 n=1 Tax=Falco rusticolus TaxID=120794 RepID=UPI001886A5E3|nr:endoplasmic reticulum-Golgi intermediate compartment protein 3-like isoform X4 [Falco rusticolus]
MAHPARERRVHSRPARRAGAAVEVRSLRREPGRLSGRDVRRRARVRPESYVDKSRGAELKFATGHNTCVFIDRFPCSLLSDLSVSAMEVTGEQQQDVEHKPFKQRLDKAASPVTPEAATHELGKEEEKVFDPNALDADRCESCYGAESEDIRR